jgi:hypothetical protein|tara:strand:- start:50 stop:271 length:222 start_codon:yes stop_codon:yes gene_type:complete
VNDEVVLKMYAAAKEELERTGIPEEADEDFEDFCYECAGRVVETLIKDGVIDESNEDTEEFLTECINDLCGLC